MIKKKMALTADIASKMFCVMEMKKSAKSSQAQRGSALRSKGQR